MEHLGRLVEHLAWADARVLDSLRAAEPAPPRALELLAHLLAAEHVWLARLEGREPALPVWPVLSVADCARLAGENIRGLRQALAALSPADLARTVHYRNSAGQPFTGTVQDILLHLAMHGAYHRGQVAVALRESGATPAPTDFIAFTRGAPAATRTMRPKLRTPDERFAALPEFPFQPHYLDLDGLRMHYLDEGPRDGAPVLLLHGEPSWCFLYRRVIPVLTAAGLRAIAPDLIGFGRSDKLTRREDYSYAFHVDMIRRFMDGLGLRDVTLVGQDWGGLIGLRLVAEAPERFARVVAANTMLPDGLDPPTEAFLRWRDYSQRTPVFDAGRIIDKGTTDGIAPEIAAAYNAPFPDPTFQEGARVFPLLVPVDPDEPAALANREAWGTLRRWHRPLLTAFSDGDAITAGADRLLQERIPGAAGQPHVVIRGAGHFLQEDRGPELGAVIADFVRRTPRSA